MAEHIDRYVAPETNGGWGFASFVLFLVVVCIVVATWVHKSTYKRPTDPTWHGIGSGDEAPAAQPASASKP